MTCLCKNLITRDKNVIHSKDFCGVTLSSVTPDRIARHMITQYSKLEDAMSSERDNEYREYLESQLVILHKDITTHCEMYGLGKLYTTWSNRVHT
jgi:hypothetical protein